MVRWVVLASLLVGGVLAATDFGPPLTDWTYQVDARPLAPQYADPGTRLNDGVTDRSKLAIWQGGDIAVNLDLGGPARMTGLRIYQFRHNTNYKLDHLSVMAQKAGQWVEVARVKGFYGPTKTMEFVHELPLNGLETSRLRLDFAGAGVLSLSEVQVFGTRAAGDGAAGAYAGVPFAKDAAPTAREADLDHDGQPELVLENRFVRLIFSPAHGGVCRSLRLKPAGTELVDAREAGYGLLRDQLWKPNYSFGERFYFHRLEAAPDHASVELWTNGSGGMMSFTEIRKRITLARDGAGVQVHYTLTNQPSSQTNYEYGFWSHDWLGVAGAANTYYFPTTTGVESYTLNEQTARKSNDAWYRNPAQGWTAVLSDQGTGLVMTMPYRLLNLFYRWHGAGSVASTHEWRLNAIELKAGEKLEFDVGLLPVQGMSAVTGVADGNVLGLDAAGGKATVALAQPGGVGTPGAVAWRLTVLPEGKVLPLAAPKAKPSVTAVTATADLSGLPAGDHVARLELLRDGKPVGQVERPFRLGGAGTVAWVIEPEAAQVGAKEEAAEDTTKPAYQLSTAVETPHIPWASPFAGGRMKALVLMDDLNSREAVELAQRIDLDLDYVKFRTNFDKELLYQGDLTTLTLEAAQKKLAAKLKANKYDVIVLAGFDWGFHFSDADRQGILGQVRAGTGLVLIQPDGFDAATAKDLPVAGVAKKGSAARPMYGWHAWQSSGDTPLTAAMDWSRFPVTRRHEYDTPPQGQVVATIGKDNQPLLTLGSLGEGRVVSATWDTLTHDMSYRGYSALTPILSYRGGWSRPEFAELPEGYHELWYALLSRLVAWAAKHETGVDLTASAQVTGELDAQDKLTLPVTLKGDTLPASLRYEVYGLTPHGPASGTLGGKPFGAVVLGEVKPTGGAAALPLPKLPVGDNLVGYTLRRPDGAALAWGFATVKLTGPAALKMVTIEPDTLLAEGGVWQEDTPIETGAFRPEKALRLQAELSAPATKALTAEFTLRDSYGRTIAQATRPLPSGSSSAELAVPVPTLVTQGLELTVRLLDGSRLVDLDRHRSVAYRPRVWSRFWLTSWESDWLWRSEYLFDPLDKLIRDWGLDVAFYGDNELSTGRVREGAYYGINHSWLGMLGYLGKGVADFEDKDFAKKTAEYAKSKDKAALVRNPSLADPAWREAVRKSLLERTQRTMQSEGGAYDYCMGDEMSLTYYTQFHDFDWSEPSLRAFRAWLQQRYPSLDALNKAWGSGFASWDAVMPLTREEAQKAVNPAPWAEFRTYMNDQLADFYAFVQETIRSVDPHAHAGLSGTQSPEAANGMDWWKVAKGFSYFHSYNTSWSNEMRRSFQAVGRGHQSPYYTGYSVTNPECEHNVWWCLLHETRGISAWKTGLFWYGDFTETPSGRDTKANLETMRRGLWRLLRGAKRQSDGIAIHYSMPSILAGALTGDEQKLNAARDAWVKLVNDLGYQYDFVAAEQLEGGVLEQGYKVLVMPYSTAVSKREADAIRRFVAKGGTVLAGRPVAERDELCRPQSPGLLDDLFGVRREGQAQAVEARLVLTEACGGLPAGTELRLPVAVSDLAAAGATPLALAGDAKVPVLLRGSAGHAVLLNLDLSDLESERKFRTPTEKQLKAILAALLANVGVKPKYPLTLESGRPPQVELVRYELDGIEYLGLMNNEAQADTATIDLGGRKHVYDVRAGADRGEATSLKVPLDPLGCRLYALAPAAVPAPAMMGPTTAARAVTQDGLTTGGQLALTIAHMPGPRQLIRLDVTDPTGTPRKELRQTLWVAAEAVKTTVPLSPSDPVGTWVVTATDVTSGQKAVVRVGVQ